MPLSEVQAAILRVLAAHRSPESYVAGGAVLNADGPRLSEDIDIFHDREEAAAASAEADAATLAAAGFSVSWLRREPGLFAATVQRDGQSTRLEWARDSDFRFYRAMADERFGYRLHFADVATNKALAAASRREPRDVLDLLHIDAHLLPLGAVIWAAVGKDPGYAPESLIREICRNARYRSDDFADLALAAPVDAARVAQDLKDALRRAETFISRMPAGKEGLLFLSKGVPAQPDPDRLGAYVELSGTRRGHWPSSPEIGSAMLPGERPQPEE